MGAMSSSPTPSPLRVASYNLRGLKDDPRSAAAVVRAVDPDVLLLQEVPRYPGSSYAIAALARVAARHIEARRAQRAVDKAGASARLIEDLVTHAHDLVVILDGQQRFVYANEAFRRTLGVGDDVTGAPLDRFVAPTSRDALADIATRLQAGERGGQQGHAVHHRCIHDLPPAA